MSVKLHARLKERRSTCTNADSPGVHWAIELPWLFAETCERAGFVPFPGGAGGVRTNEGKKNMHDKLGGERGHVVTNFASSYTSIFDSHYTAVNRWLEGLE